jgi:putative ABC transport system permease protein
VPGVEIVAQKIVIEPYKVLSPTGRSKPRVLGVSGNYGAMMNLAVQEGRFLDTEDDAAFAQVCVIGTGVRRDLFGFEPVLGKVLKVNDQWLTVVGVLAPAAGAGQDFQGVKVAGTANDVYIRLDRTVSSARPPRAPSTSRSAASRPRRRQAAAIVDTLVSGRRSGRRGSSFPSALEHSRRTQRLFNIVMGCIAGISLLVGGIGIMNIMLATVLERTREIGVRRALGARRLDIRNQFIIEAFTISVLGGVIGVAMGLVIAKGVAFYAGWDTVVTIFSIALSTGVSLTVGLVFGIYPALRAAHLDPIEALRYE